MSYQVSTLLQVRSGAGSNRRPSALQAGPPRPLLDAAAMCEQVSVVGHGVGLASVVEVVAAGAGELGEGRRFWSGMCTGT